MAIIRFIIAFACLPLAQICVAWFFFYTTSGIGLLLNEGISGFRRVYYHMNDNNGEDETYSTTDFYDSVNNTPFFKFLINEIFLLTIYIIYAIVKIFTMPFQASKFEIKMISVVLTGILILLLLIGLYKLYRVRSIPNNKYSDTNEPNDPNANIDGPIDGTGIDVNDIDVADNNNNMGELAERYSQGQNPETLDITIEDNNPLAKKLPTKLPSSINEIKPQSSITSSITNWLNNKNKKNDDISKTFTNLKDVSLPQLYHNTQVDGDPNDPNFTIKQTNPLAKQTNPLADIINKKK